MKILPFERDLFYQGDTPNDMVLISKGEFMMGGEEYESESPIHVVFLSDYWVDKYLVTNAQYKLFNPDHQPLPDFDEPYQPVVNISWHEALMFAYWAEKRLPTEAEWEKTARGERWVEGRENKKAYPWGDEWKDDVCNGGRSNIGKTSPVATYPQGRSCYGCFDLAGNIWEWCLDWYDWNYYSQCHEKGVIINPVGVKEGRYKVIRGGSFADREECCKCNYRGFMKPDYRFNNIGFRCVKPVGLQEI
ncbi:formylglycine-generating enzyme family protein [bacterium]|nr:formylglycine-generating enzyme family protein [bacterium]